MYYSSNRGGSLWVLICLPDDGDSFKYHVTSCRWLRNIVVGYAYILSFFLTRFCIKKSLYYLIPFSVIGDILLIIFTPPYFLFETAVYLALIIIVLALFLAINIITLFIPILIIAYCIYRKNEKKKKNKRLRSMYTKSAQGLWNFV